MKQVIVIVCLIFFFGVISGGISLLRTHWVITRHFKCDGAPLITRRIRITNTWIAVIFFAVFIVLLGLDLFVPTFHDRVRDIQDRIEDVVQATTPSSVALVSVVFWLSICMGIVAGCVPGQWCACRLAGKSMATTCKVKLADLVGPPWF
jgi:hypothetical protein